MPRARRVAHFLLHAELAGSPPNDALAQAYRELGYAVDFFAPRGGWIAPGAEGTAPAFVEYGRRWLARNAWRPQWRRYSAFSGTCEEPAAVVGTLALFHQRPAIVLADEIRAGAYRGNAPASWKRLCRFGMRRAALTIVNDPARERLQRDYAGLSERQTVVVYPGGFRTPPPPADRFEQRRAWNIPDSALTIGFSGLFSALNGGDWLIEALQTMPRLHAVVQPLGVEAMVRFLLPRIEGRERLFLQTDRLDWRESWSQAAALDIGMAIYLSRGPQFQLMGTSSNRLCMFLAMGVPVIASRQESLNFLEEYDCGLLIGDRSELPGAIETIAGRLEAMKRNARRCWAEHVRTEGRYQSLVSALREVL